MPPSRERPQAEAFRWQVGIETPLQPVWRLKQKLAGTFGVAEAWEFLQKEFHSNKLFSPERTNQDFQ
jgi:hypothetical protein